MSDNPFRPVPIPFEFVGGPLDGQTHELDVNAIEFQITMRLDKDDPGRRLRYVRDGAVMRWDADFQP